MTNKVYDVVIVGGGLGGMLCAGILAAEGMRVCLLEKNNQIGGTLQTFVRDKCIIDTGVHYVGGFGEGESLWRYFRHAGIMDDLRVRRMDLDGFDVVSFEGDDQRYPQAQGYERFIERLSVLFPQERHGIEEYCRMMQAYCQLFPLYYLDDRAKHPDTMDHLMVNAQAAIASLIKDPKLRAVLAANNMIYAGDAHTPFYMHALVTNAYIESAWRCVDGGGQISKLLVREIRKHGGEIYRHCQAKQFHFKDRLIESVELTNGERVFGKRFISNIHPVATLRMIEEHQVRKAYRNRINSLPETISCFCTHVTLEHGTVPYRNYNICHLQQPDVWTTTQYSKDNWLGQYMISMGASSRNPDYMDNLGLMAYMRYDEVARWGDVINTVAEPSARAADYEAFKQERAALCVDEIIKHIPEIQGRIKGVYTSTPLSFRDYIGSPNGSLYGTYRDCRDPAITMISPKSRVENLWMTGQNINIHGILGVTVSAYLACFEIVGRDYLLAKVLKA